MNCFEVDCPASCAPDCLALFKAPLGAAHFKELVQDGYYTDLRFFRVIKGFMAQFGMHGNPDVRP